MKELQVVIENLEILLKEKESIIIAIDGKCASGKTTLAKKLQTHFDCNVIHADDFFLTPIMRTEKRLKEIGGNMDRERLLSEVLVPLKHKKSFEYRVFSCKDQRLTDTIFIMPKKINIIEGSYSCHPDLFEYYDYKIFVTTQYSEQIKRISLRNPEKVDVFKEKWIPMEERYFSEFRISDKADMIINT